MPRSTHLVITAKRQEDLEKFNPEIQNWLQQRGLTLNAAKTRIVSIEDGFNFLGFNVRHYHGKCLVKPEKAKVLNFLRDIRVWLKSQKQATAENVVRYLNPVLRGWANYYRHFTSKDTYAYVDAQLWKMLWSWSLRRHPNKGKQWVKKRYFGSSHGRDWRFRAFCTTTYGERFEMAVTNITTIAIKRHVKVKGAASPDDSSLVKYWLARSAPAKVSVASLSLNA